MPMLDSGAYRRAAVQRRRPHGSQPAAEPADGRFPMRRRRSNCSSRPAKPPPHRRENRRSDPSRRRSRPRAAAIGNEARRSESADGDDATVVQQWSDFPGDSTTTAVRQHRLQLKRGTVKPGQTVLDPRGGVGQAGGQRLGARSEAARDRRQLARDQDRRRGGRGGRRLAATRRPARGDLEAPGKAAPRPCGRLPSPLGRGAGGEGDGGGCRQDAAMLRTPFRQPPPSPSSDRPHPNPLPKGEGTKIVTDVRNRQIEIQKQTADLAKSIGSTDRKERLTTKRVLSGLAFGEMVDAVAVCDALLKGDTPSAKSPNAPNLRNQAGPHPNPLPTARGDSCGRARNPAVRLTAAQDRIIDVLRKLLDVARQAQAEVLAEMKKRPGADLPDDAKHKLEEIRKKLDKFLAAAEEDHRGQRKPRQDAGRGFLGEGRGTAQTHGRRRGRLGEVHEGSAFRPEQTARAGFRQLVDGEGTGRNPDRAENGGRRTAEEVVRHRRAVGAVGLREGRGTEDELRKMAARHPRPREMEPGGIVDRQGQRGPDGRIADGTGRSGRRL